METERPLFAEIRYTTESLDKISSSTIVGKLLTQYGLNYRILSLLEEYASLEANWDDDDAFAPNQHAINNARYITSLLEKHGQPIFHAAPGPYGEIMLDIRNKKSNKSIEIIFYEDRSVIVSFAESEKPKQMEFKFEFLNDYLAWLNLKNS